MGAQVAKHNAKILHGGKNGGHTNPLRVTAKKVKSVIAPCQGHVMRMVLFTRQLLKATRVVMNFMLALQKNSKTDTESTRPHFVIQYHFMPV